MFKNILQKKGFTLVELMLYVAMVALMMLFLFSFLQFLIQSRIKNQVINEIEQQAIQVSQRMNQVIRNAVSITSPAIGANATSLEVTVLSAPLSPTIFDLKTGAIRIKEGGAGINTNLTNSKIVASDLVFYNLSRSSTPGTIRWHFTLTYNNPDNRQEYNFSQTFFGSATLNKP